MDPDDQAARVERSAAIAAGRGAWKDRAQGRDLVQELIEERHSEAEVGDQNGATSTGQMKKSSPSHLAS